MASFDLRSRLAILADAAKHDASCASLRLDDVARLISSLGRMKPFPVTPDWLPTGTPDNAHLAETQALPPAQLQLF